LTNAKNSDSVAAAPRLQPPVKPVLVPGSSSVTPGRSRSGSIDGLVQPLSTTTTCTDTPVEARIRSTTS
jgi:hypothetical protein